AILRCRRIDDIGGRQAAGAGPILRDDRWVTRDVFSHMSREMPRVEVVSAANREPDDKRDAFSLVELLHALGPRRQRRQHGGADQYNSEYLTHAKLASADHIGGKICGNFARSLARRSPLTSTTVGNLFLSFIS